MVREKIAPRLAALAECCSTAELEAHPVWAVLRPMVAAVLATIDTGDYRAPDAPSRPSYRVVAWNLERGIEFEGQLAALRAHPYLRSADVLLATETDLGMARSANRAVAQELARALGMAYAFAPCYLNLSKGAGLEYEAAGENALGLHGNAVLSRYPIRRVRAIRLANGIDKMTGREKRVGCQAALAADIELPGGGITVAAVHLDAQSTQRHRWRQMRDVLEALPARGPVILGGDWNTSTYNSSRAFYAILGFWLRVLMGVDHVIRNHYLYPYRRFEKELFALLEQHGFDYRAPNVLGERTSTYHIADDKARKNLGEWVPAWCFPFIHWALRGQEGQCPLKLDWFATRGLRSTAPVVLHEFREGRERPLSDHDPIGVDISL